jgi:hypothetical protein
MGDYLSDEVRFGGTPKPAREAALSLGNAPCKIANSDFIPSSAASF